MANNSVKQSGILAGCGCVFGLAPLIVSLLAAAVGSNIGNTLHWYTLFTAPVGAIIVIIGLVGAVAGAAKATPEDLASSVLQGTEKADTEKFDAENADAQPVAKTETPSAPVVLQPLSASLARVVKLAYAVGFGVVLVSCLMRVTIFQPFSGILTLFDLVPAVFAGWLVFLARKASEGLGFLRLVQAQMIVSIAGCVVGLYPLTFLSSNIDMLGDPGGDDFQWGGTIITGLIPMAASVASLVFAEIARSRYRATIAKN